MDDWVVTSDEMMNEEKSLEECWRSLPFDIPYDEFRAQMLALKRKHQRGRFTNAAIWTAEVLWWLSGYATTALSALQYRSVVMGLFRWFMGH